MRVLSLVAAGVLALFLAGPLGATPAAVSAPGIASDGAKRVEKPKAKPKPLPPKPSAKPKAGAPKKSAEVNLGSAARQELLKNRLQSGSKSAAGKAAPAKTKKKMS